MYVAENVVFWLDPLAHVCCQTLRDRESQRERERERVRERERERERERKRFEDR